MAETFTPAITSNLANQTSVTTAIDNNFAEVATLFEDTLSRSGTTPNSMSSVLDMNSNQIINVGTPTTLTSVARLVDINNIVSQNTNVTLNTGLYAPVSLTGNYTVTTSDSGKMFVYLPGVSAVYTVTVPSATGFTPGFSIQIQNSDNRAKTLSIAGQSNFYLYPTQKVTITQISNIWILSPITAWTTSSIILYLDPNGNDSNDGLAPGASNAMFSLEAAWNVAIANFQSNLTILMGNGVYSYTTSQILAGQIPGSHDVQITAVLGSFPNSSNVAINFSGSGNLLVTDGAIAVFSNIQFNAGTSNITIITVNNTAGADFSNCIFGDQVGVTGCVFLFVWGCAKVTITGPLSFSCGSCEAWLQVQGGGFVDMGSVNYYCIAAMNFSSGFILGEGPGQINIAGTFSGVGSGSGSTGFSVSANRNSLITGSSTANLPGASGTTSSSGGILG